MEARSECRAAALPAALSERLCARLALETKRLTLSTRRRRARADVLWVDYGWAQLPYTADRDEQELLYHLHQAEWRARELTALAPLVSKRDTVFDIGANLGFYSVLFAQQTGPQGRVVAFEPARRIFSKLRATIAKNGLDQVIPLNLACGSASVDGVLRQVSRSTGNASLVGGDAGNASLVGGDAGGEAVPVRPLDEIPEALGHPPQLVKIDVEGFESEVLEGAQSILREHRPVLYIELCGEYLASTERSIALLDDLGYDTRRFASMDWNDVPNGTNFIVRPSRGAS
jgi:FkbM family methyltransferase